MAALTAQFDREVERSLTRVGDAVAPDTRFVAAEQLRLTTTRAALRAAEQELAGLQRRVEML